MTSPRFKCSGVVQYEDRILRLEAEVERLRSRLKDESEFRKVVEKREAFLSEKVCCF